MREAVILMDRVKQMRSEAEIKDLVTGFAKDDDRVRVVLLNGSRVNPNVKPDKYRDFDIVFLVNDLEHFTSNHSWTDVFGEKLIWQLPDEMSPGNSGAGLTFSYLMLFTDGNRIDLTLFPIEKFQSGFKLDSLTDVWLDKDNLFFEIQQPADKDYHVQRPVQREFSETCNEFWWVSTYVAKGLLRNEITYAKEMLDTVMRPMFMKVIAWKIGAANNFSVSFGKSGKFMSRYLTPDNYARVLQTYSDFEVQNNWRSLLLMAEFFEDITNDLSLKLNLLQNKIEQQNAMKYLKKLFDEQQNG